MSARPKICPECGKDLDPNESLFNIGLGKSYTKMKCFKSHKKKACERCFDERYKKNNSMKHLK